MNKNTIVYRGDPLEQMNGCGEISTRIYHLDEASVDKIKSYSKLIEPSNVPPILREQVPITQEEKIFFLLTNKRNEYEIYPETYIAIENTNNCDFAKQLLIYGFAKNTGLTKNSGFCSYPLWVFDESFLAEIGGEQYQQYSKAFDDYMAAFEGVKSDE